MKNEIWKDVVGYERVYQVSNFGRVKSLYDGRHNIYRERILKAKKCSNGYLRVCLYKNNTKKFFFIHRLVAKSFLDNPCNLPQINHKDENKENNNASNLEWCSAEYNNNYGSRNEKISESKCKTVYIIDLETGEILNVFKSISEAAEIIKINANNISTCCNKKRKTAGGYKWEYIF